MAGNNSWKTWVIGILGAIMLSFGGIVVKGHLEEVNDIKKKAESATIQQATTAQEIKNIQEKTNEIKDDVKEIKKILQEQRRIR